METWKVVGLAVLAAAFYVGSVGVAYHLGGMCALRGVLRWMNVHWPDTHNESPLQDPKEKWNE